MESFRVRDVQINFRCTENEKKVIEDRCAMSNCNDISTYLRKMAMNGYVINVNYDDLKELVHEINKIGTNINQIAHHVNSDHEIYQTDMDKIQNNMNDIWRLLRSKMLHIEDDIINIT